MESYEQLRRCVVWTPLLLLVTIAYLCSAPAAAAGEVLSPDDRAELPCQDVFCIMDKVNGRSVQNKDMFVGRKLLRVSNMPSIGTIEISQEGRFEAEKYTALFSMDYAHAHPPPPVTKRGPTPHAVHAPPPQII